jgi:thioredoxin 1
MHDDTLTLTDQSWDADVLKSELPVLVDFWGSNCGPCLTMAPIIDALAGEYTGKLRVGKLKVEDNLDTAVRYRVMGIPMFLLFKGGQIVEQKTGSMGKPDLVKMIGKYVSL